MNVWLNSSKSLGALGKYLECKLGHAFISATVSLLLAFLTFTELHGFLTSFLEQDGGAHDWVTK